MKTPRVVVRDGVVPDTKTLRPKLYHLYRDPAVAEDLNRRGAEPHEPLPSWCRRPTRCSAPTGGSGAAVARGGPYRRRR